MDNLIKIPEELNNIHNFQRLSSLISRIIEDVENYSQELMNKDQNISLSLEKLTLNDNKAIDDNRDIAIVKAKMEIVNKTLSKLYFSSKLLIEKPDICQWLDSGRIAEIYVIFGGSGLRYDYIMGEIKSFIKRLIQDFLSQLCSLDSGYKSPYNFSFIIEKLLQSLNNHSPVSTNQVQSLLKFFQSELEIIKELETMNDGQRALISIYCNKLNILDVEISSVNAETENKPKQRKKKLRDIVDGIRLMVKDTFELIKALKSIDWINESDEIFVTINDKGIDAFDDLIDYMEKIKREWIGLEACNETRKVCRLAALRRINVELKKVKKLKALRTELESSWVIAGIKNTLTNFNHIHRSSKYVANCAYDLTHDMIPKDPIDVPKGFIRDDIIYGELKANPCHGLLIVLIHIVIYQQYFESLTWNKFQKRKPRRVADYLFKIFFVIDAANASCLDDNELHEISFDLADRYLMTKQKIANDRDALEYRLFRHKPKKPFKFEELQKRLKSQHGKRYKVRVYMEEHFDEMIDGVNRKVSNHGQRIIYKRAIDMMKRSLHTFKIMRSDYLSRDEFYLIDLLINQAANEYCYAAETVVKLLNDFRPNRRIPFSFYADGHFTKQIDKIGLEVKDEFESEVDSLIDKLKRIIKEKDDDLESTKDEKTQLRYLRSIVKRSKMIPVNELEMSEQDEVDILKEIIEEYEYTMLTYGHVDNL